MSEVPEIPESADRRLGRMVAVTVVALSVAMAVGKIKDDNIVQAMQADQSSKIDLWSEYQATQIKAHEQETAALLLTRDGDRAHAVASAARYRGEAKGIKVQAQAAQTDYDVQGRRDDQFDLADGFLSIAVAVAAIAALVESLPVLAAAWLAAAAGMLFLVAGFTHLPIHPDALVALLT